MEMPPLGSGSAGGSPGGLASSRHDVPAVSSPRAVLEAVASCLPAQVPGIPIPEGDHRAPNGASAPASSSAPSFSLAAARWSLERERGFGGCWLLGWSSWGLPCNWWERTPAHLRSNLQHSQGRPQYQDIPLLQTAYGFVPGKKYHGKFPTSHCCSFCTPHLVLFASPQHPMSHTRNSYYHLD